MARTPKTAQPLDIAIAEILADRIEAAGITRRALEEKTGMSANRIGIILRADGTPATVGEVGTLAGTVGMTASDVINEAERLSQADVMLAARDADDDEEIEAQQNEA